MTRIAPCLWFDGTAEAAATLYTSLFSDSRIESINRAPADNPSTNAGAALTVAFTLCGRPFIGLNGGPRFPFTEAVSFSIDCADQEEVDRYWDALIADGGAPGRCGWLKDRFGVSWQVVPRQLPELLGGPDRDGAARAMQAMLEMTRLDVEKLREAYQGRPSKS